MNQQNKEFVWNYWKTINEKGCEASVAQFLHSDVIWHGFRPLRHLQGEGAVWAQFWQPLLTAMPDLLRRPYIFIGNSFEGNDWVCGTGDFIGTFAHDWMIGNHTIPANGHSVHFRFGEFCKVANGQIVEIRIIVDLIALLRQCDIHLVPPNYGRDLWVPGAFGICLAEQNVTESQKTYDLVTNMIFGGLNKYDGVNQASQGLEQYWHSQMIWHGPAGIGSAYGIDEFKQNAQGPIVNAFPDRRGVGHQARIADGRFAASTGWPSLGGTHINPYMDWPPTGEYIGWNIMDFWRRDGDKLAENWVLIDLIDAAMASGVDLLQRLPTPD